jgi:hypothetical protein
MKDTLARVLDRRQGWVLLTTEHDQDGWMEAAGVDPLNQGLAAAPAPQPPEVMPQHQTTTSSGADPVPLYEHRYLGGAYFRVWPNRIESSAALGIQPAALFLRNVVGVETRRGLLVGAQVLVVRTNDGRKHEFFSIGDASKAREAILRAM